MQNNMDYMPKSEHTLPDSQDKFETPELKGQYVNAVIETCNKATMSGDKAWNDF
jgi:hypothetical protein